MVFSGSDWKWSRTCWADYHTTANQLCSRDDITPDRRFHRRRFSFSASGIQLLIDQLALRKRSWSITFSQQQSTLPNLRAQRHREVLFTLSSRFSVVWFSSVQSSCVAIDWFCVCTADHTSVIFTPIIEIYRVVVFLPWSSPGLSPRTNSSLCFLSQNHEQLEASSQLV